MASRFIPTRRIPLGGPDPQMSIYRCPLNPSHADTDQNQWPGCRQCWIEAAASNTSRFFDDHLHKPGTPWEPYRSEFTYQQINSTLTFMDSGTTVTIQTPTQWLQYITDPSRSTWKWNTKHNTPNLLVTHVGWGATGSGTTISGSLPSDYTGLLIANALQDPHGYPVDPGGYATKDLTSYMWVCSSCDGMTQPYNVFCLPCSKVT